MYPNYTTLSIFTPLLFLRISPRMGLAWGVLLFSPPLSAANARSMQGCWNSTVASSMSMEFTLQRWPPFFVVGIPAKFPVKQHEGHKKRSKGIRILKSERSRLFETCTEKGRNTLTQKGWKKKLSSLKNWKFDMDVSENSGTPKWMVYNGNPY